MSNYRTLQQPDERSAVEAIIATNPDWFWALTQSLLDDGYLPTENILVQKEGSGQRSPLIVKEGNRRISALKLIHGLIPSDELPIPSNILGAIESLPKGWKRANSTVPTAIYEPNESDVVNRIRSLTHGKGEKAGRDKWTAVARARHNREENGTSEPALDLLEKYLQQGKNRTEQQAQRWAGDFPLTVLEEAIKRIAPRLGCANSPELAKAYPKIKYRTELEEIIKDIGQRALSFDAIRKSDFSANYGIPPLPSQGHASSSDASNGASGHSGAGTAGGSFSGTNDPGSGGTASGQGSGTKTGGNFGSGKGTKAVAMDDPRRIKRILRDFAPRGKNREKVVSLAKELCELKIDKNPIAFCFVLRSMFEVSSKAYCIDHKAEGLTTFTKDGRDKPLVDVLRDVTKHLTNDKKDKEALKRLHGAMTELGRSDGILSVTSMNQLVHNPKFSLQSNDIVNLLGNIFPLLEEMN
ncbi:hypothetical protein [Xanthomonas arboricola]|uniref:hypothetical protein n=1 Tax=Xanthomonas arboricola TaxID=56448 RepID=UPI00161E6CCD|nr:hypothetical protein [Xanthomonas arboricola]MBB4598919.1 putative membrane protein YgcG [Xanthomonas arboricola]